MRCHLQASQLRAPAELCITIWEDKSGEKPLAICHYPKQAPLSQKLLSYPGIVCLTTGRKGVTLMDQFTPRLSWEFKLEHHMMSTIWTTKEPHFHDVKRWQNRRTLSSSLMSTPKSQLTAERPSVKRLEPSNNKKIFYIQRHNEETQQDFIWCNQIPNTPGGQAANWRTIILHKFFHKSEGSESHIRPGGLASRGGVSRAFGFDI